MFKFTFLVVVVAYYVALANADLVNEEVNRVIDLKSHLVKITTTATLKNGKGGAVSTFKFTVDPSHAEQLAYIAFHKSGDDSTHFKFVESDNVKKVFVVTLPSKLDAEDSIRYVAEEVYTNAVSPFPKEISQSQNQLLVYRGNHFFYSPYLSESQTTTVELPSNTVESFSNLGGPDKDETTIKYGDSKEFENVAPNSQNALKIHYENNTPFLAVSKLTRVIEISHWGNIAVEEHIDVRHTGAKLKGSFSRYDYQRMPNSGASSVKSFKTLLPAAASDVYYRDEIGNISTSNLYETEESVDFEIRPRFPLFGGWKTFYYIGYNLPSYNYLYSRGDLHALKMRFVDHVMDDQMVEDFTLKIILPEGAKNIKASVPFPVNRLPDELHYTYLDTVGRPVIIMKKSNLVEQHIDDFIVSYSFNRLLLLQEPLLIVGAFFLLFFTVILFVRLDFSIAFDQASEAKMRVNGIIEQVQDLQAKRDGCYKAYENAIAKYKSSKDHTGFTNAKRAVEKEHKEATNKVTQLIAKLRDDSGDAAEKGDASASTKKDAASKMGGRELQVRAKKQLKGVKKSITPSKSHILDSSVHTDFVRRNLMMVAKLNQMDASLKDKYAQRVTLGEKLVNKKLTREQYVEQDGKVQKAIDRLKDEAMELSDNLVV